MKKSYFPFFYAISILVISIGGTTWAQVETEPLVQLDRVDATIGAAVRQEQVREVSLNGCGCAWIRPKSKVLMIWDRSFTLGRFDDLCHGWRAG